MSTRPAPNQALIGFGQVRHTRLRPQRNAFAYPTYFLMLPMRALRAQGPGHLARNRPAALAFHDSDHGDARADSLAWLDEVLHWQDLAAVALIVLAIAAVLWPGRRAA